MKPKNDEVDEVRHETSQPKVDAPQNDRFPADELVRRQAAAAKLNEIIRRRGGRGPTMSLRGRGHETTRSLTTAEFCEWVAGLEAEIDEMERK